MGLKNTLNTLLIATILSACASPTRPGIDADKDPINLIPMYGYPDIEKTEEQKKADELFIETVTRSSGSREKASWEFAGRGWHYLKQGDNASSMRRFNQSWLLNPGNYMPYWGFGVLLNAQGKSAEAIFYYDRALWLIREMGSDKPRLLADAAKVYVAHGRDIRTTDKAQSEQFFEKANTLANDVFKLDPQFGNEAVKQDSQFAFAYRYGERLEQSGLDAANTAYVRGDYNTALREYRLLAEQEDPGAQVGLAEMYLQGHGVQQDHIEAMKWYRKAAEQGDVNAQNSLGYMYENAPGVQQDIIKAYMWYYIASTSGHVEGSRNRDIVAGKMSPSQIDYAHKLAHKWMMNNQ